MRRILSLFILLCFLFSLTTQTIAESISSDEELIESTVSNLNETSRTLTIPIRKGPIYSVILGGPAIGIVFDISPAKLALGLEMLSFATDLAEMDFYLSDGNTLIVPAFLTIDHHDEGTFIILNVSSESANSIATIINRQSDILRIGFVQRSGNRVELTVSELNAIFSVIYGNAVNVANAIGEAGVVFWKNLKSGAGTYAKAAFTKIGDSFAVAGTAIGDTASMIGGKLGEAASAVGDAVGEAAASVGQAVGDAATAAGDAVSGFLESSGSAIGDVKDSVTDLWNGFWKK